MSIYLLACLFVLIYMSSWFLLALLLKRNDIADIAWGLGFVCIAWLTWFYGGRSEVAFVVNLLITLWGVRLSTHIYRRNSKRDEDYRYQEWRRTWKNFYVRSYLQVFLLQGLLMLLISLPTIALNAIESPVLQSWAPLGVIVWLLGFYFEVVGDWELKQFIRNPDNQGKLMTSGLWKYTRHPNYFGEVTQWWGIFIAALGATGNLLLLVGPVTITLLILFVSGIPLLEKKYEGRTDWEEYKQKTSMFLPWQPGKFVTRN